MTPKSDKAGTTKAAITPDVATGRAPARRRAGFLTNYPDTFVRYARTSEATARNSSAVTQLMAAFLQRAASGMPLKYQPARPAGALEVGAGGREQAHVALEGGDLLGYARLVTREDPRVAVGPARHHHGGGAGLVERAQRRLVGEDVAGRDHGHGDGVRHAVDDAPSPPRRGTSAWQSGRARPRRRRPRPPSRARTRARPPGPRSGRGGSSPSRERPTRPSRHARTILAASAGSSSSAEPSPFLVTLGTGHAMLTSMSASRSPQARRHALRGLAEELRLAAKELHGHVRLRRVRVHELPALLAVVEAGAGDHLGVGQRSATRARHEAVRRVRRRRPSAP